MELTGSDENQVKAGPNRDKEKKRTRWPSSTDMFYCACAVLTSELGELWEPVICRKSDQIIPLWIWTFVRKGVPFWLQTELILHHLGHSEQQLISIWIWISLQLLTHLWIKISGTLIPQIQHHVKGIVICAIMISLWNLYLLVLCWFVVWSLWL